MSKRRILAALSVMVFECMVNTHCIAAEKGRLPRTLEATLRTEILPAYRQGNSLHVLQYLSTLVPKLNDEALGAVDAWLTDNKLPRLAELVTEIRLSMVEQNLAGHLPKAHPREIVLIVPEIKRRIEATVAERDAHPAFANPLPKPESFDEYEELFREIHLLEQRCRNNVQVANYGRQLIESLASAKQRDFEDLNPAELSTDLGTLLGRILDISRNLEDREIALRLARLDYAVAVLDNPRESFRERFLAAWAVDVDGVLLSNFFKHANRRFTFAKLNEPNLAATIAAKADNARGKAGDLVQKSRLFHEGLQWWLRGRYGSGPAGYGMLKSELALTSPQAQFGLYMPNETPLPTNPLDGTSKPVPIIDRRHHYIWMFEYRRITSSSTSDLIASGEVKPCWIRAGTTLDGKPIDNLSGAILDQFDERSFYNYIETSVKERTAINQYVTAEDPRMVYRLVGCWEYGSALKNLQTLVNLSPANELEVYDQLVMDGKEFTVYTNLSRLVQKGPSSLAESNVPGESFERRGLRWVMALARVELGAMLAAFTDIPTPFEAVGATEYDGQEYWNLLLDGVRSHYWALANDPMLRRVARGSPGTEMLAYVRRLTLARRMLSAVVRNETFNPVQYREMQTWGRALDSLQGGFVGKVKAYLESHDSFEKELGTYGVGHLPARLWKEGMTFSDVPVRGGGRGLAHDVLRRWNASQ